jgi:hypothetical protein
MGILGGCEMDNMDQNLQQLSVEELEQLQIDCKDTIWSCKRMLAENYPNPGKVSDTEWLEQVGNYRKQKEQEKRDAQRKLFLIETELENRREKDEE